MTDTKQPEALRLANCLQDHVVTYPQLSEDEPGGYCGEVDRVMDESAAELRRLHARVQELERAVADEREACALLAEQAHPHDWAFIGATIRARGAQGESNAD